MPLVAWNPGIARRPSNSTRYSIRPSPIADALIMRILGIDPGLSVTGYGCVDLPEGAMEPLLVEAGVFRLGARRPMAYRLAQLFEDLEGVLEELAPDRLVVECLFSHYKHVRTALLMGHARGVVILAGQRRGMQIAELAPTEVKRAVTGCGHASKLQMQRAVMVQCNLDAPPQPHDVADAIAIALCDARRVGAERAALTLT
jgi:crossover junction endodeoxyribonuclease RuvC